MTTQVFHQLKKGRGDKQLILFPYLGGNADSFSELVNSISDEIEIWSANLPGHGRCTQRVLLQDIDSVIDLYAQELQTIAKPNCIYFGHSMGGIIAYFLAQRILSSEEYPAKPAALILSACSTPAEFSSLNASQLSNEDIVQKLISYDGIPEEILKETMLLDYLMPIFRADFKILESSSASSFSKLNLPVYYLWGDKDRIISIDSVIKWSKYFTSDINLIPIKDASHMYIHNQSIMVRQMIESIVNGLAPTY